MIDTPSMMIPSSPVIYPLHIPCNLITYYMHDPPSIMISNVKDLLELELGFIAAASNFAALHLRQ